MLPWLVTAIHACLGPPGSAESSLVGTLIVNVKVECVLVLGNCTFVVQSAQTCLPG